MGWGGKGAGEGIEEAVMRLSARVLDARLGVGDGQRTRNPKRALRPILDKFLKRKVLFSL